METFKVEFSPDFVQTGWFLKASCTRSRSLFSINLTLSYKNKMNYVPTECPDKVVILAGVAEISVVTKGASYEILRH